MLIEVAPDKFPCLGPSELRKKRKFCRVCGVGQMWFFGKECSILWRCAPILEFVTFLGGWGLIRNGDCGICDPEFICWQLFWDPCHFVHLVVLALGGLS